MNTHRPDSPADDGPRDESLSRAYHDAVQAQAAGSEPRAALDDAIRAAARRAVHAGPRDAAHAAGGGWFGRRWQTPMALAASMVLAVGVAIKVYDTGEADVRPAEPLVPTGSASAGGPAPNAASSAVEPQQAPAQAPPLVDAAADANANAVGQGGGLTPSPPVVPTPASVPPAARPSAPAAAPAPARPAPPAPEGRAEADTSATTRDSEMLRQDRAERRGAAAGAQVGPASATPSEPLARIITREEAAGAAPASESKSFPAERARESTPAEQASAGVPKPAAAPQDVANTPTGPRAPATPQAAAPAAPPAPNAKPAPAVAAASIPAERSTGQSVQGDRALRDRSAMKVEQAEAAPKPGVGTGLSGRMDGRMQSGAGPAAAPRPLIASAQELQSRPAEDWLASIRELRRTGRTAEADELLTAFRKQFPDFALPSDLR